MQPVLVRLVEARERLGMLSIWQPSYNNPLNPHIIDDLLSHLVEIEVLNKLEEKVWNP
jgi:hypothetical protein